MEEDILANHQGYFGSFTEKLFQIAMLAKVSSSIYVCIRLPKWKTHLYGDANFKYKMCMYPIYCNVLNKVP